MQDNNFSPIEGKKTLGLGQTHDEPPLYGVGKKYR